MPNNTYNEQFRDASAEEKYPLSAESVQTRFPVSLFLDASLYVPTTFSAPFFISAIEDAPGDAVRVIISDTRRVTVGQAVCGVGDETALIKDEFGRSVGMLVYDSQLMDDMKGDLFNGRLTFSEEETELASDVCRFYTPSGVLNVWNEDVSFQNHVRIVFSNGLHIDPNGNVNLYGEHGNLGTPLRTINGIPAEHYYFLAHVFSNYEDESALRIESDASRIKVGKSRDFN